MYKIHYKEKALKLDHPISIFYRGTKFIIIIGNKVFSLNSNYDPDNLDLNCIIDEIKKLEMNKNQIHIKTRMDEDFDIFYRLVRLTHIIYSTIEAVCPKLKVNILICGCGDEKGITPRSFSIKFRACDGHPKTRVGKSKDTVMALRQKSRRDIYTR